jgi:hypothetical protein
MALAAVVVAGSAGSSEFAVVNFGNTPPTTVMVPCFQNGNVVDCYGTLAAVGENSGSAVSLFDISDPAFPVQMGSANTNFQIGSLSIDASYVLAGELSGSRVALIDISNPASPYVLGVSDCAPLLNIISSVALRSPTAVVSGDNNSVVLYFEDNPPTGAVPVPLLYNAWPSDFDGTTAAVANAPGGIQAYAVSGNTATQLALTPYGLTASVAVAEIPAGGYFVAAGGTGSFTVFAYPTNYPSGSITTPLPAAMGGPGTAVKFLNNPAIAPFLAVANVTAYDASVSFYWIQVDTGSNTVVSFFSPIPVTKINLPTTSLPTLGITAFTPKVRWRFWPFPFPGWLTNIWQTLFGGG